MEGKTVLFSGGARGKGAAYARRVVEENGRALIGDVLVEEGKELAESLGDASSFIPLDLTHEDGWRRAVEVAHDQFGTLTGLVNNAGILL